MTTKKNPKMKKNRSAFIRCMICNFDDQGISEMKVLFNKQSSIDVINFSTSQGLQFHESMENHELSQSDRTVDLFRMQFENIVVKNMSQDEQFQYKIVVVSPDLFIVKKWHEGILLREYSVKGHYQVRKNQRNAPMTVAVEVEDLMYDERAMKRKKIAKTQRKLLELDTIKIYKQILNAESSYEEIMAQGDKKNDIIDSQKIYMVNHFLKCRTEYLMYYQVIDKIYKTSQKNKKALNDYNKENVENKRVIIDNICQYLKEKNGLYIEKQDLYLKEKLAREKTCGKKNKQHVFFENKTTEELIEDVKKLELDGDLLGRDVERLIYFFALMREKIYLCDCDFFEKLYLGDEVYFEINTESSLQVFIEPENVKAFQVYKEGNQYKIPLSILLDISFFDKFAKIENIKYRGRTNYLTDSDKFLILGKQKRSQSLYDLYHQICHRKEGLNQFINEFFIVDGKEEVLFKKQINEHYIMTKMKMKHGIEQREEKLKALLINQSTTIENKRKINKVKDALRELKEAYGEILYFEKLIGKTDIAYENDIHQNDHYKKLYNEHNELAELYQRKVNQIDMDASSIDQFREAIKNKKEEMKRITYLNSKFKLRYKMILFYNFLYYEFDGDFDKFMAIDFDEMSSEKPKETNRQIFIERREQYLNFIYDYENLKSKDKEAFFNLGDLSLMVSKFPIDNYNVFDNEKSNNYFKMMILFYTVLPREIRGNVLGTCKRFYYQQKLMMTFTKHDEKDQFNDYDQQSNQRKTFYYKMKFIEKNIVNYKMFEIKMNDFLDKKDSDKIDKIIKTIIGNHQNEQLTDTYKDFLKSHYFISLFKYYMILMHNLHMVELQAWLYHIKKGEFHESIASIIKRHSVKNVDDFNYLMSLLFLGNKCDLTYEKIQRIKNALTSNSKKKNFDALISFNLKQKDDCKDKKGKWHKGRMSHLDDFKEDIVLNQPELIEIFESLSEKINGLYDEIELLNFDDAVFIHKKFYHHHYKELFTIPIGNRNFLSDKFENIIRHSFEMEQLNTSFKVAFTNDTVTQYKNYLTFLNKSKFQVFEDKHLSSLEKKWLNQDREAFKKLSNYDVKISQLIKYKGYLQKYIDSQCTDKGDFSKLGYVMHEYIIKINAIDDEKAYKMGTTQNQNHIKKQEKLEITYKYLDLIHSLIQTKAIQKMKDRIYDIIS